MKLIRHTKVKDPTVCYGQLDVELDQKDFDQSVIQLKKQLGKISSIYSSPSNRCWVLAKALCDNVIVIDELLEMNFGAWQGSNWSDIPRAEIDAWAKDVENYQIPYGESCADFFKRAKKGFEKLESNSIIITHAGIIRAYQYWYANKSFSQASQLFVEHGFIYEC